MRAMLIIATRELLDGLRNRWVAAAIGLLTALALSIAMLGSAPIGELRVSQLSVTVVSLASLSVYLLPLIALMLSFDTLVGEMERGTLLLLLTYPVTRWQLVLGKFLGHLAILLLAIVVGYGLAALVTGVTGGDAGAWWAFARLMASSLLLGAVFAALGQFLSVIVRERATAVGAAIGVWIGMVVIYDLALLAGLLTGDGQWMGPGLLSALMVFNPTDAYRIFNLAGAGESGLVSGMAGLQSVAVPAASVLLGTMTLWLLAALAATITVFRRKEL